MADNMYCIPGDCLIKNDETITALNGTYCRNGYIYASIAGTLHLTKQDNNNKTIEVINGSDKKIRIPSIGSIVTCRVLSINANQVRCSIHCIEDNVLKQPFRGLLRKEDIRDTEKDKIEVWKCFRPADIILAKVFGIGENHNFLLTTAENELGVVVALNEFGIPMKPISWTEMLCQTTFNTEPRKVANIIQTERKDQTLDKSTDLL